MSRSALIVFGLALLLLSLGAVMMFRPASESAPQGPLLGVQPSEISVIRVRRPEAERAEIVARDGSDRWRFRLDGDSSAPGAGWPVLTERARGVARVLATLRASGASRRAVPADALRVEVGLTNGAWKTLRFDDASVGGQRTVEIDGEQWLVDAAIVDLFRSPGLRGWRDPAALPGLNVDVSRVTIRSPDQTLQLARTGGAWRLQSPFVARADEVAVRRLVTALANIRVERFLDDETATGDAAPTRVEITCETDERQIGADDRVEVTTRSVTLGLEGPADVAAQAFFATDGHGRRFVVAGSALTDMSLAPESYVALTPTAHTPADVGMVQIEEPSGATRAYRRGLGNWSRLQQDGTVQPADGGAIDAMLQLLCATPATAVAIDPPEGLASLGAITLLDFDNGPLVQLGLGSTTDNRLVVRVTPAGGRTPIYLVYESAAPAILRPSGLGPSAQ